MALYNQNNATLYKNEYWKILEQQKSHEILEI